MHNDIEGNVTQHTDKFAFVCSHPGIPLLAFSRHLFKDLEEALAKASGTEVTAKVIYEIEYADEVAYIEFTGDTVLFGQTMER